MYVSQESTIPQNTIQKSISIVFCVSAIRHDSSLSKYRKQKQSPPWKYSKCHTSRAQNTTQKSISIAFCVSSIRHDSSLNKYRKQKQSPPWTCAIFSIFRGGCFCLRYLLSDESWRIDLTQKAMEIGLLCSILCPGVTASVYGTCAKNNGDGLLFCILWLYSYRAFYLSEFQYTCIHTQLWTVW